LAVDKDERSASHAGRLTPSSKTLKTDFLKICWLEEKTQTERRSYKIHFLRFEERK